MMARVFSKPPLTGVQEVIPLGKDPLMIQLDRRIIQSRLQPRGLVALMAQ